MSINAGMAMPKAAKHKAPIKEMKRSSFGYAAAKETKILITY